MVGRNGRGISDHTNPTIPEKMTDDKAYRCWVQVPALGSFFFICIVSQVRREWGEGAGGHIGRFPKETGDFGAFLCTWITGDGV